MQCVWSKAIHLFKLSTDLRVCHMWYIWCLLFSVCVQNNKLNKALATQTSDISQSPWICWISHCTTIFLNVCWLWSPNILPSIVTICLKMPTWITWHFGPNPPYLSRYGSTSPRGEVNTLSQLFSLAWDHISTYCQELVKFLLNMFMINTLSRLDRNIASADHMRRHNWNTK